MISTGEAAERLGVSDNTIREYIRKGFITAKKLPSGHYRVDEGSVRKFELHATEQVIANDR